MYQKKSSLTQSISEELKGDPPGNEKVYDHENTRKRLPQHDPRGGGGTGTVTRVVVYLFDLHTVRW